MIHATETSVAHTEEGKFWGCSFSVELLSKIMPSVMFRKYQILRQKAYGRGYSRGYSRGGGGGNNTPEVEGLPYLPRAFFNM